MPENKLVKKDQKAEQSPEEMTDSRRALMNMLEDVEEARRNAEEEKNKTLALITNLSDGLIVLDINGGISLVNPQIEKFFNVKSEEVVGKSLLGFSEHPTLKALISTLKEENVFRKELNINEKLVVEVSTVKVAWQEKSLGTMIVLHDISREKMIEGMKTEFVSLAAHQLRTPLSAIKWTVKMLLDGDVGALTNEQKEIIGKTYRSNERMIGLINDLLNVTRIEEGRYLYKPNLAELDKIVSVVVNSHNEEIKRKGLKIEVKKPRTKFPKVRMDEEKIMLAVQNLLENAIKYTPAGGTIEISLKDEKKEVLFKIKDTGVGIPKDQQARIFSKFFRGANVVRMDTEGSGLGVFLAKNIVDAHGGKIWFESEEGKGTSFFFTLPVKKEFEEFLKEF